LSPDYERVPGTAKQPVQPKAPSKLTFKSTEQSVHERLPVKEVRFKDLAKNTNLESLGGMHRNLSMNIHKTSGAVSGAHASFSSDFEGSMASEISLINAIEGRRFERPRIQISDLTNPVKFNLKVSPLFPTSTESSSAAREMLVNENERHYLRKKQEQFAGTLRSLDLSKSEYDKLVASAKTMVIADISGVIQEHHLNLNRLDSWLQGNFGRRLYEAVLEQDSAKAAIVPNLVDLDELASQLKALSSTETLIWQ